jgi:hypothetical protein
METEFIKKFNKAYKDIKKRGFQNYFCLPNTTWKEAKEMFDAGFDLDKESEKNLNRSINLMFAPLVFTYKKDGSVESVKKQIEENNL